MSIKGTLNQNNSILVVWDVQNGLVKGIFNRDEFLRALDRTLNFARNHRIPVVFTRITPYPEGFEPFAMRATSRQFKMSQEDLELYLKPSEHDIVIPKNTWSIFVGTNFELLLRNSGRNVILFTGIATEIGVETSARHAFALGFLPVIVSDAVSSFNKEGHERSLMNMKAFFPVISSDELEKTL
ncbi:MAG: isochorismatase family cysteine hydrolase [Metallosphaera sp.]|uniref:isochorismatase family cysteine hydrolase n=1 Tax=Metallosphaera sp. TaxID=2020860 RepID=UPI00316A5C82